MTNEKIAINRSEELDIALLLNSSRYNKLGDRIWPRIIDNESIDFYHKKIIKMKDDHVAVSAGFDYKIQCNLNENIMILYDNKSKEVILNKNSYSISFPTDPQKDIFNNYRCWINNNETEVIISNTPSININISNGYIINQNLKYYESYGAVAGYGGSVEQVIVLDKNYDPLLILSMVTNEYES